MGDFKQNRGKRFGQDRGGGFERRDGGRPSFGGKSWGADRDRGPVTLHRATCAKCGSPCEVPFRPVDGRPVYCRNCFQGQKDGGDNMGASRFPQKDFGERNFSRPDSRNNAVAGNDGLKNQLEMLNAKMDRLIRAVESMAGTKTSLPESQTAVTTETTDVVEPVFDAKAKKTKKGGKKVAKKKIYKRPF